MQSRVRERERARERGRERIDNCLRCRITSCKAKGATESPRIGGKQYNNAGYLGTQTQTNRSERSNEGTNENRFVSREAASLKRALRFANILSLCGEIYGVERQQQQQEQLQL